MFKTLSLTAVHLLNSGDWGFSSFLRRSDRAGTADLAGLRSYGKKMLPNAFTF